MQGGGMSASQPVRPRCYNRAPFADGRLQIGINRDTGARVETRLSNDWFTDACRTWSGVGIGQPTEAYPTGTPYPMAKGWDCTGCRWKPEGTP